MKTIFVKSIGFVLLLLTALSFTSCDKIKRVANNLEGDWKVKSFTIDGVEAMRVGVNNFTLEFDDYSDDEGDFEWRIIYVDGTSETLSGEYGIDDDGKELELNANDKAYQMDMDLDGDELELEGIVDGEKVIIKADKD